MSHSFPKPIGEIVLGATDKSFAQHFGELRDQSFSAGESSRVATEVAKQLATSRMLDEIHDMLAWLCRREFEREAKSHPTHLVRLPDPPPF